MENAALACLMWGVFVVPATAQWKTPNKPGTVQTQIEPDAPAPRTADDKADFSGLWAPGAPRGPLDSASVFRPSPYPSLPPGVSRATPNNIGLDVAKTDEALAIVNRRADRFFRDNPRSQCQPMGIIQLHT